LEKQIDAYVKGHLSEEQALKLWEELLKQPKYIELLRTELGVKSIVSEHPADYSATSEPSQNTPPSIRPWAAAAAVIIIAVTLYFFSTDSQQPLRQLGLNSITLSEQLASAPILRSDQSPTTPGDSLLNLGFKAAISGDLSEATAFYDTIIDKYPEQSTAIQAYLNKGIIQFNRDDFAGAISFFKKSVDGAKTQPLTREKGYWYLGNAYVRVDSLSQAHDAVFEAYSMEGVYQTP